MTLAPPPITAAGRGRPAGWPPELCALNTADPFGRPDGFCFQSKPLRAPTCIRQEWMTTKGLKMGSAGSEHYRRRLQGATPIRYGFRVEGVRFDRQQSEFVSLPAAVYTSFNYFST